MNEGRSIESYTRDINEEIESLLKGETNGVSDGYHTFGELYEHRITLYITLCKLLDDIGANIIWMSKAHSDGSVWDGWFILGINEKPGEQITYHLPMSKWEEVEEFCLERNKAPEWDGHTAKDVLKRLKIYI